MAATKTETGFVETFRNLVTRFDDNQPGGGETAYRKSVILCAKNGLSFVDAAARSFGQEDGRTAELETENAELREEVERRKQGGDELADALTKARQEIAALQGRGESGGRVWSTKSLLLALAGVIVGRIGLYMALGEKLPEPGPSSWAAASAALPAPGFVPWLANMVLVLSGAWLLAQWHRAQHAADGWGQLVMKWLVLGLGLFLASVIFFGGPPWDTSVFQRAPVPALVVTVLAVLLVLSKFTERLAEKTAARAEAFSMRGAVSWLMGWFV